MSKEPKSAPFTRRKFLNRAISTGIAVTAGAVFSKSGDAAASKPTEPVKTGFAGPMGVPRVARLVPTGYQATPPDGGGAVHWVQVDLGTMHKIDTVKLLPMTSSPEQSLGFPIRFRIEASGDPLFKKARLIADCTGADYADPGDAVGIFPSGQAEGRYVRLTATRLRQKQLALSKLEVWSSGKDVAEGCPAADSRHGSLGRIPLTRAPRPQGEEVVTDNPSSVIPAHRWKPVAYQAHTPLSGVRLEGGVFQSAMDDNIGYLLSSFSVDEMLHPFRDRANKPSPPNLRPPIGFWDTDLPGSSAGRFLMGAGNTLRWQDHPELRRRMDQIIDGIEECRMPNGYIMAYPEDTIFYSERGAYTRSWLTHGLIEAGYAGNPKAFPLLRGYYDWFDRCPYLPELLRRAGQGVQGMIANTRLYFTPVGKPEDIQVVQRYFQEDYWMKQLAAREDRAIWQYPYDHPHNYLLTSLEPYLDQYRATGDKSYLEASLGGWDLYHDKWEHVGGTIAICEGDSYPPKSYYLHRHTGELCGSVFWARFNQRFHLLYPDQEKYVGEIEKAIYNAGLANQAGAKGIRYHANLVGRKDAWAANNTCCEGQGTRLLGSLPEYIYSTAKDGVYVNLFAASSIQWQHSGHSLGLKMTTEFPFQPSVRLSVSTRQPTRAVVHVRVPAWAAQAMPIHVNGVLTASGKPGTFAALDRTWADGDTIAFTLPMAFKMTLYEGIEQVFGADRNALEYGPVLMALVGGTDGGEAARLAFRSDELVSRLRPIAGRPLHFAIEGAATQEYMPYWQVDEQAFNCYPVIGLPGAATQEVVGPDDLALASKGATATSDGEYTNEPGGTIKVIDDTITPSGDLSHRWHSSLETPHPHWIQVTLPKPATIGRVVIRFADPAGHPTSFQGIVRVQGQDHVVFDVQDCSDWHRYEATIKPVTTDTFRLLIRASANPVYPNAAQISRIELYPPPAHE